MILPRGRRGESDGKAAVARHPALDPFHKKIPFERLCKNFNDAIKGTRVLSSTLGKLYLCIDALCIVRDSDDDWGAEFVKMGHIYGKQPLHLHGAPGLRLDGRSFRGAKMTSHCARVSSREDRGAASLATGRCAASTPSKTL